MRSDKSLSREQCREDHFSSEREALNLGDDGKFARFRKVLEGAINSVLDLSGDSKVKEMKFHLLLRGICNVTRIPYRVLDSETGEEIEIDHPFYEKYKNPTNGLLYYNIQRLIKRHFRELLPVARITKRTIFVANRPKCYPRYGCEPVMYR